MVVKMEVTAGHSVFELTREERRAALVALGVAMEPSKATFLQQAVMSGALLPGKHSNRVVTVDEFGVETEVEPVRPKLAMDGR